MFVNLKNKLLIGRLLIVNEALLITGPRMSPNAPVPKIPKINWLVEEIKLCETFNFDIKLKSLSRFLYSMNKS